MVATVKLSFTLVDVECIEFAFIRGVPFQKFIFIALIRYFDD